MSEIAVKAIQIDQDGGPEQLKMVDIAVGDPGPGQICIRHKAAGLNFVDVYQRRLTGSRRARPRRGAGRPGPARRFRESAAPVIDFICWRRVPMS